MPFFHQLTGVHMTETDLLDGKRLATNLLSVIQVFGRFNTRYNCYNYLP